MKRIVDLAKNLGFVFQGSEIYGGLASTWDYGSLGSLLMKKSRLIIYEYRGYSSVSSPDSSASKKYGNLGSCY